MANVLITDLFEESAYLVRSLLRSNGHAVSIAITEKDAKAKLSTGLFDVLAMDFCTVVDGNMSVAQYANDELPDLPVVALTNDNNVDKLSALTISGTFSRPIRGRHVNEAITSALNTVWARSGRRTVERIHTSLPISIVVGGVKVSSTTIDLSSRGVAVDTTNIKWKPDELEAVEDAVGSGDATAELTLGEGKIIKLSGKLAFVERHRSFSGRTIGLAFDNLDEETEIAIKDLYKEAA
ncbi:MAG: PilZ domain-containing protein [Planctomycetes bacterium]|nr:PilZ domain-containing protein [Planctomycetota bacterium]